MLKAMTGLQNLMAENRKKRCYYLVYTVLFLILMFFCFSFFIFSGKSLIWESDGWRQHYKALVYYSEYLKNFFKNLFGNGSIVLPEFDFAIGEGSDVLNTMHYYVMGDPVAFLSVLVPASGMHIFYSFSCILRLYLAGIIFSELCFHTGVKNRYGILAGAIGYGSCLWGIVNAARHPFFINPLMYFPLLILGIELIIRKGKPYLFIISVALSAMSNFYFFYMMAILAVVYALVRLWKEYKKDILKGITTLIYMGVYAIVGMTIAGAVLVPVIMSFLADSRIGVEQPFHLFYPWYYYKMLPGLFLEEEDIYAIGDGYWLILGINAPAIFSAVLLFADKGKKTILKIFYIISGVIIIFPIFGRILNGMSYMTNRWSWALVLLFMYTLTIYWDELLALAKEKRKLLIICSICLYVLCMICDKSRNVQVMSAIPLFFAAILIIGIPKEKKYAVYKPFLVILLICFTVFKSSYWLFNPPTSDYTSKFISNKDVADELKDNEVTALETVTDVNGIRYTGGSMTPNINVVSGVSNTQYYWTLTNPEMNVFRSDMNIINPLAQSFSGYDDRTSLIALSASSYYVLNEADKSKYTVPYGYELISTVNTGEGVSSVNETPETDDPEQEEESDKSSGSNWEIYKNKNKLPYAYFYESYISADKWNAMNPVQKQESMLKAAYVDGAKVSVPEFTERLPEYITAFDAECQSEDITLTGNSVICTAAKQKIVLKSSDIPDNCEIYVAFEGLDYEPVTEYELYFGDDKFDPLHLYDEARWEKLTLQQQETFKKRYRNRLEVQMAEITVASSGGVKKVIEYFPPDSSFSSDRHNFIANLGYYEKGVKKITLTFAGRGIYTFDSMKIYCVPMSGYEKKINKLKSNQLKSFRLKNDAIYGKSKADKDRILCIAVPYYEGWRGYIDKKEVEVLCVNEHYLGLLVPAGTHDIELHYVRPYQKTGYVLSLIGIAAFIILLVFRKLIVERVPGHDRKTQM